MACPRPVSQLRVLWVLQVLPAQPGSAGVPASLRGPVSLCPHTPVSPCPHISISPSQPCCANLCVPVAWLCAHLCPRPNLTAWTCVPVSLCPCVPVSLCPRVPIPALLCQPESSSPAWLHRPLSLSLHVPVPALLCQSCVPVPCLASQPLSSCPHPSLAVPPCVSPSPVSLHRPLSPSQPHCTKVAWSGPWGWPFPRDDDSDRARARVRAGLTAESRRHCLPGETEAGNSRLGLAPAAGAGAPGAEPRPRGRLARRWPLGIAASCQLPAARGPSVGLALLPFLAPARLGCSLLRAEPAGIPAPWSPPRRVAMLDGDPRASPCSARLRGPAPGLRDRKRAREQAAPRRSRVPHVRVPVPPARGGRRRRGVGSVGGCGASRSIYELGQSRVPGVAVGGPHPGVPRRAPNPNLPLPPAVPGPGPHLPSPHGRMRTQACRLALTIPSRHTAPRNVPLRPGRRGAGGRGGGLRRRCQAVSKQEHEEGR